MRGGHGSGINARMNDDPPLLGREEEARRVDELVDALPGRGGTLLIGGEAGIGKSALLRRARDRAESHELGTLSAVGAESEAALAFAGLHQLLVPVLDRIERLPEPQQQALRAAFGEAEEGEPDPVLLPGPVLDRIERLPEPQQQALRAAFGEAEEVEPDRFLVAVAAFGLICEAAVPRPLLVVLDDAQWLDPSSLAALTFIAHRLETEQVVMIAALREGHWTPLGD